MIEKRCVNNKPTLFVTEHCPKVLLFGTKTTSKSLCWRMTHRVKCPGEGKETFLCRHARPGLRSRTMVGRSLVVARFCVMGRCGGQNGSHSRFTTMKRKTSIVGAIPCGRPVRVVARCVPPPGACGRPVRVN